MNNHVLLPVISACMPYASGFDREPRLSILIFHRILRSYDFMRPSEVTSETFDWQMELISSYFNPLTLNQAISLLKAGNLPPKSVCVTFDDGYADNVAVALPILRKWNVPATFFIATGFLDGGRMWNDTVIETIRRFEGEEIDLRPFGLRRFKIVTEAERNMTKEKIIQAIKYMPQNQQEDMANKIASLTKELPNDLMMTKAQVKELLSAEMDIGGHTVSHPILATLPPDKAREEIAEGKAQLEAIIAAKVKYFAYPSGKPKQDYTIAHAKILPDMGFEAAVSTQPGVCNRNSDLWQLPRFTPWDNTPTRFALRTIQNYRQLK